MSGIDDFSVADRFASCLSMLPNFPATLTTCFPTRRDDNDIYADRDEREGLLSRSGGSSSARHDDAYDDADAISLLSNIANSDARRAARRRARGGRGISGMGSQLLACGLFGRARGQIQQRETTVGSSTGRRQAARSESDSGFSEDSDRPPRPLTPNVESGDEDAGMVNDAAIAKLSRGDVPADDEDAASQARKRVLAEAEAAALEAEEADKRLAEEEAQLAAQEEAAIAKARRKAERRAAKAGLAGGASKRKKERTDAQAEAAAGGFAFVDEQAGDGYNEGDWDETGQHRGEWEGGYDEHGRDEAEGYYVEGSYQPAPAQEVVHHHHYYHAPPSSNDAPSFSPSVLPALPSPSAGEDAELDAAPAPVEEDEDDADIAGLSFGKKKKRRGDKAGGGSSSAGRGEGGSSSGGRVRRGLRSGGSQGSNSANGSAQGSASGLPLGMDWPASRGSISSDTPGGAVRSPLSPPLSDEPAPSLNATPSLRPSYRDKPRRHERTSSRSTNNSSNAGGRRLQVSTGGVLGQQHSSSDGLAASPNTAVRGATSPSSYLSPSSAADDLMPPPATTALSAANLARAQERRRSDDAAGSGGRGGGSSNSAASRRARGLPPLKADQQSAVATPPPWARSDGSGSGSLNTPRNPVGAANIFS